MLSVSHDACELADEAGEGAAASAVDELKRIAAAAAAAAVLNAALRMKFLLLPLSYSDPHCRATFGRRRIRTARGILASCC